MERIDGPDLDAWLVHDLVASDEHDGLLAALIAECDWTVHRVRVYGRNHDAPRRSAWHGDPGMTYTYSGLRLEPAPWTPTLALLRDRIAERSGQRFNAVLGNHYRHGHDSMGWHADDEPELGPEPPIASVSFGAPRRFVLRRRDDHRCRREVALGHGALLWIAGASQRYWQHAVPRTARPVGERVNLTYRRIVAPS